MDNKYLPHTRKILRFSNIENVKRIDQIILYNTNWKIDQRILNYYYIW
jgi:hypothetical protein